jgi:alpha-D-glucose phosphate-specific phosphoglucomutase
MITFGTAGWRSIIADGFTFQNVRLVTQAIAMYLKERGTSSRGIVVGYDARFLSDRFARVATEVLAGNGIKVFMAKDEVPTPALSFEILRRGAAGSVNITASHNPPEYSGLKFSPEYGGPVLSSETDRIQEILRGIADGDIQSVPFEDGLTEGLIESIDPRPNYLHRLKDLVDIEAIKRSGLKVIVNPMHGAARGYLDAILRECGCEVRVINDSRDPLFGGRPPEPVEEYISDLITEVREEGADLGLAVDGDADRFGIVDKEGCYIEPNMFLGLLTHHLLTTRGHGAIAKTCATSHLLDAVGEQFGVKVIETEVGFKNVSRALREEDCIVGCEESGGLAIKGHIPDKDGILACLLAAEMVAREGKHLRGLLRDLYEKTGPFFYRRINILLPLDRKEEVLQDLQSHSSIGLSGVEVKGKKRLTKGVKFFLHGGDWVLIRPSGTEPVLRCYVEARHRDLLETLTDATKRYVMGGKDDG